MSAFSGSKKETKEFQDFIKRIGVMEVVPVAVNPDKEELEKLLDRTLEKEPEYLGTTKDGDKYVLIKVYVQDVKTNEIHNVPFFIEDRVRMDRDEVKTQWINSTGQTTWAVDEDGLREWFTKDRKVRKALVGEEELYAFLRVWLQINFKNPNASLELDTEKLFKGNVRDLQSQIHNEFGLTDKDEDATVVVLATVKTKDVNGEKKQRQIINSKNFLPGYTIKFFNGERESLQFTQKDAQKIQEILDGDDKEAKKKITPIQRFVASIMHPKYPVKEFYGGVIAVAKEYDVKQDPSASDSVIVSQDEEDSNDYSGGL